MQSKLTHRIFSIISTNLLFWVQVDHGAAVASGGVDARVRPELLLLSVFRCFLSVHRLPGLLPLLLLALFAHDRLLQNQLAMFSKTGSGYDVVDEELERETKSIRAGEELR